MRLKHKLVAGFLAAVLAIGNMAPAQAMADGKDENGIYRWEIENDISKGVNVKDAEVKEITVKYTEKANSGKIQSVDSTARNEKITAQLKTDVKEILWLYYTEDNGKNFKKVNMDKIIRKKMGFSEDMSFWIYDFQFFGDLLTLTGYYQDAEENTYWFVLASKNMKTFVRRDMPTIENSGDYVPYLEKIGTQYIWYVRQDYWSQDPKEVANYKFIYYAGSTLAKMKKKNATAKFPFSYEESEGVDIGVRIQASASGSGMNLMYTSYIGDTLLGAKMLLTKDLKTWSKPIDLFANQAWTWTCSSKNQGVVLRNVIPDPADAENELGLVSFRAYDYAGKELGFSAVSSRFGYLDIAMSGMYITEKKGEIQYITILDGYTNAFTVTKDGNVTVQVAPICEGDEYGPYDSQITYLAQDTEKGVFFISDYSGNVYMTQDGFVSFVRFAAPDQGKDLLDINVVGNYLIFDFPEKTCKVSLSSLYKNFK